MPNLTFPDYMDFRSKTYCEAIEPPTLLYYPDARGLAIMSATYATEPDYNEAAPTTIITAFARHVPMTYGDSGWWSVALAFLCEWTDIRHRLGLITDEAATHALTVFKTALDDLDAACMAKVGKPARPARVRSIGGDH